MNNTHPSNVLYNGEATDFIEAMDLYRKQMEYENEQTRKLAREFDQPLTDEDRKLMKSLTLSANKAGEAKSIYNHHIEAVKAAIIAELRAKNDEEFAAFADALESGDYTGLAI